MHYTRIDIVFIIIKLVQYTFNQNTENWKAMCIMLWYLKRTSNLELTYIYFWYTRSYYDTRKIDHISDFKSTKWLDLYISWMSYLLDEQETVVPSSLNHGAIAYYPNNIM